MRVTDADSLKSAMPSAVVVVFQNRIRGVRAVRCCNHKIVAHRSRRSKDRIAVIEEEIGSCRRSCVTPISPSFAVDRSGSRYRAVVRGRRNKVDEISPVAFSDASYSKRFRHYLLPEQCRRVISPSIAAAAASLRSFAVKSCRCSVVKVDSPFRAADAA